MREIDVRGLDCPIPVVKTKKALEEDPGKDILVLTDSPVATENVSRLAQASGCEVVTEKINADEFRLLLIRSAK